MEGQHSRALESQLLLELVCDFSDQSLEGELSDEEISGFLVFPDFSEGNCSGFEAVGFLDSSGDWGALSGDLLSHELLSGHLLGSGLPCSLFCSSHLNRNRFLGAIGNLRENYPVIKIEKFDWLDILQSKYIFC